MPYRKESLVEGEVYHICSRSIAEFKIFNSKQEFDRIKEAIKLYAYNNPPAKLSEFLRNKDKYARGFSGRSLSDKLVKLIAYCIMPTHLHMIIQGGNGPGISRFVNLILKSYSLYFNLRHKRKGPLWEARFKSVSVKTDEQLLHLTRYVHLNPVTAFLVERPEDWEYSSYKEYLGLAEQSERICVFEDFLDISANLYREFVNDRISYQRELAKIKYLIAA